MAFTENYSEFLQNDDFAIYCTLEVGTVITRPLVILDYPYFSEIGIEDTEIRLTAAQEDFETATHESKITLTPADLPPQCQAAAGLYRVRGIQPDGTGMLELILSSDL